MILNFKYLAGLLIFLMLLLGYSCSNDNKDKSITAINIAMALANENYDKNNFAYAITLYTQVLALDTTKAEAYFKRGYSKSQLEDSDGSTADYMKAIALSYRIDDAYCNIALNYGTIHGKTSISEFNKKDSISVYYYQKALSVNPQNRIAKMQLENREKFMNKK